MKHQRKSLILTRAGKFVLEKSHYFFEGQENFKNQILGYKDEVTGHLTIGISRSLAGKDFSQALKKFLVAYPKVDLKIKLGKTENQKELLESGKIDIGICINHGKLFNVEQVKLRSGSFLFLGKKQSELNLLLTEPRPETQQLLSFLERKHPTLLDLNSIEIESWSIIWQMIQAGLGKGLVPDFMSAKTKGIENFSASLKLPSLKYDIICFYKKQHAKKFPLKKFLPYLKQYF